MEEPYPESIHVEVHHENGEYWAQVKEWPGCFASGRTLGELTEALEDNVALYLAPDPERGDKQPHPQPVEPIQLHILEMELRLGANRPLNPARDDESDAPFRRCPVFEIRTLAGPSGTSIGEARMADAKRLRRA